MGVRCYLPPHNFTVRLPLPSLPTTPQPNQAQPTQRIELSGLQILAVNDELDIRNLVAFILKQAGATVKIAASASEALDLIKQLPDAFVCDIGMPDIDGYMLMRQISVLLSMLKVARCSG